MQWAKFAHDKEQSRLAASGKSGRKARSMEARVKYAQYCHKRGALSKANQAMTSDLVIDNDPVNLPLLQARHPDPTHPDRDPTERFSPAWADAYHGTVAWLDSQDGREWVEKVFDLEKVKRYFRTRSPVGMADPDGCKARDMVAKLLDGDDDHLHTLIRDVLILPYLTGDFDDAHMSEYAGAILFAILKPDGTPRPIACASIYRRCLANLACAALRPVAARYFTSKYDNFIQCAGTRDGASHLANILNLWYNNLSADPIDPTDPCVIVKLDMAQAFQTICRALTLDVFCGTATRDYACGFKNGDTIPSPAELSRFFGYVYAMRSAVGKLRYHASNGDVSIVDSKTGGQQGDPFEMLAYAASVHPVLGSILAKFHDDAAAAAYADDLYLTGKLRAILPLLAHLNEVVPADTGMSFNLEKIRILVKDLLPADVHNTAKSLIESDGSLHTLRALVDRPEVFVAPVSLPFTHPPLVLCSGEASSVTSLRAPSFPPLTLLNLTLGTHLPSPAFAIFTNSSSAITNARTTLTPPLSRPPSTSLPSQHPRLRNRLCLSPPASSF